MKSSKERLVLLRPRISRQNTETRLLDFRKVQKKGLNTTFFFIKHCLTQKYFFPDYTIQTSLESGPGSRRRVYTLFFVERRVISFFATCHNVCTRSYNIVLPYQSRPGCQVFISALSEIQSAANKVFCAVTRSELLQRALSLRLDRQKLHE